jgi:hypothetical protein
MKRVHEGLNGYIQSLREPGEVSAPNVKARLPVGPGAGIPNGLRPIPSSSQAPKKTNATLVYSRTAVNSNRDDEFGRVRPTDVGGLAMAIAEGDLVFTLRAAPATRAPMGQNVKSFSMARVNEILKNESELPATDATRTHFDWRPDGVCNNLDGEDPHNEFKDFGIANVAIGGFVRFSTLALPPASKLRNTDRVLLALVSSKKSNLYKFVLFTSQDITTGKNLPFDYDDVVSAWTIGRVVDGKQSKSMTTLCVCIDEIAPEQSEWPYMLVADDKKAGSMVAKLVKVYKVADQLKRLWLDGSNADELLRIEAEAQKVLDTRVGSAW